MFCVYWTTYSGDKFPPNYIGSTSLAKINSGYLGSVSSRKWKAIWDYEVQNYPSKFSVKILSYHPTRDEALSEELKQQLKYNVVRSTDFVNESLARVNGFHGRDVSGSNNPMFENVAAVEKRKITMKIPEIALKHKTNLKNSLTPDIIKRRAESLKKTLSNPDVKAKRSAAQLIAQNKPETKEKQRQAQLIAQNKPETKEKHSASLRKQAATPEAKALRKIAAKSGWIKRRATREASS
jgi:hypothetical protein